MAGRNGFLSLGDQPGELLGMIADLEDVFGLSGSENEAVLIHNFDIAGLDQFDGPDERAHLGVGKVYAADDEPCDPAVLPLPCAAEPHYRLLPGGQNGSA